MRKPQSGLLAFLSGAALIVATTGSALAQDESPAPETSPGPEASPAADAVEPSSLAINLISRDVKAREPLTGKKLKKAEAKAAPAAARYVIDSAGEDAIGQIIGLSLAARAADEAGDPEAAAALIAVATLFYRGEWTKTKSDPVALNDSISSFIEAGDYPAQDPALVLASFGEPGMGIVGLIDICVEGDVEFILNPAGPSECDDGGGRQVRADFALVDPEKNGTDDLFTGDTATADVGGVGIHKVIQDKTANDKLTGKKHKKALAKALKKSGLAIAGYEPGERGVIEMVLAARAADEAGNPKAAKAFMGLALAAYRAGVPALEDTTDYNAAIVALIEAEYPDIAGLQLYPPDDMTDVCYTPKGECLWGVDGNTPWECEANGGSVIRLPWEEADCAA